VGISTIFQKCGHFLFKVGWDHHVQSWLTYMYHKILLDRHKKQEYIYGLGNSTVFEIFDHFLIMGERTAPCGQNLHTIRYYFTKETRIWFRGGDLIRFLRYFSTSCIMGEQDHSRWLWHTHHQLLLDARNKNIYGWGVGISTVFEIFGHFLFKDGTIPYGHDLHTIWCSLVQGTRIYTVLL
jgi:hypothetical protein